MTYRIRPADLQDRPALQQLIAESARVLSAGDYVPEQVEAALRGTFGVDSQLILDGTYLLVESDDGIAGCGGWSYRRTLFGGDSGTGRDASELDPRTDPARIRAFFVHPAHARKGVGTLLLEHCEQAARARGFRRVELMATLPGVRLYAARGYRGEAQVSYEISAGVAMQFVPMSKAL
ncbi:MAG TPA: GNAT family N-acetyltransferase [Steroidobacteraceae bacterium]|nr:GNAT family N-acetyltransferase [Steroidobacteraceae bacterium]